MTYRAVTQQITTVTPSIELSADEMSYCQSDPKHPLFAHRLATCLALRELLHLKAAPILRLKNGKPTLKNRRETFSVAHKDDMIFVCMHSDGIQIGVDLEDEGLARAWSSFQGRFFNHQDWLLSLRLSQILDFDKNTSMLILFTAKEALLKCTELEIDPLKMTFNLEKNKSTAHQIFLTSQLDWQNKQKNFCIEIKRQNKFIFAVCLLDHL